MTKVTHIMIRFMMMALAVIMILGATAPTAHAGPLDGIKGWAKDKYEDKKEEIIDKAKDEADERTGGWYSKGEAFYKFVLDGEFRFLKVGQYTDDSKQFISLLLLAVFLLLLFRNIDKNPITTAEFVLILILVPFLSMAFEFGRYVPEWTDARNGIRIGLAASLLLAPVLRLQTFKDLRLAVRAGGPAIGYFLTHWTHNLRSAEELALASDEAPSEGAQEGTEAETPAPSTESETPQEAATPEAAQEAAPEPPAPAPPAPRMVPGPACPQCRVPLGAQPKKHCTRCGYKLPESVAAVASAPPPTPTGSTTTREDKDEVDILFSV